MALGTRTRETAQVEFREVSQTGVFLARTEANHKNSMAILQQSRSPELRALDHDFVKLSDKEYLEALFKIIQNPEFIGQLKGKWVHLERKGIQLSRYYHFDNEGKLIEGKGDKEKTIYLYSGKNPLSLDVLTGYGARINERRFDLDAGSGPQFVASVVVGVPAGHEVATPNLEAITKEMVRAADTALTSLEQQKTAVDGGMEKGIYASRETLDSLRKLVDTTKGLIRE